MTTAGLQLSHVSSKVNLQGGVILLNFTIHSLSNGHEDIYVVLYVPRDFGGANGCGAFPLELSRHASRLVLPFSLKSLSIPRH